jgi:Ni/Fe-hydrogenase subunit HybB-like protein
VIAGYGAVLALHFLAGIASRQGIARALLWPGVPLALATAVYTAYLFAQAKARDLWQNPLLPPHLAVQAVLAGAAILLPAARLGAPDLLPPLGRMLALACLLHLLLVAGEHTLTHGTAHARLAAWEMVAGRFRNIFWLGAALVAAGMLAPWIGAAAAPLALLGLLAFEHAYVQAGQAVPLA